MTAGARIARFSSFGLRRSRIDGTRKRTKGSGRRRRPKRPGRTRVTDLREEPHAPGREKLSRGREDFAGEEGGQEEGREAQSPGPARSPFPAEAQIGWSALAACDLRDQGTPGGRTTGRPTSNSTSRARSGGTSTESWPRTARWCASTRGATGSRTGPSTRSRPTPSCAIWRRWSASGRGRPREDGRGAARPAASYRWAWEW